MLKTIFRYLKNMSWGKAQERIAQGGDGAKEGNFSEGGVVVQGDLFLKKCIKRCIFNRHCINI